MKQTFKISEFAKLRNVDINSLRYYEKLGLLKPASVDPKTGYRYYTVEQLPILDIIILCVNLGIPLKNMKDYIDIDGNLKFKELISRGKQLAQEHISEIQSQLCAIERSLARMESAKANINEQGVYTRIIESRQIIITPEFTSQLDAENIETKISELFIGAQSDKLSPIMPACVMVQCHGKYDIRYRFFLEIANKEAKHPQVITLPAGEYSCFKIYLPSNCDLYDTISEIWGNEEDLMIIIDNFYPEKFSFKSRPAEIQRLM